MCMFVFRDDCLVSCSDTCEGSNFIVPVCRYMLPVRVDQRYKDTCTPCGFTGPPTSSISKLQTHIMRMEIAVRTD